ncbi:DUF945 family protein [Sessilibacter corallicola]|uniref:DUF945 family protein n=1 Tax=Sessilibacter corallicola TaxID=2904075 RepID=A0ABQ0A734_9GAMM
MKKILLPVVIILAIVLIPPAITGSKAEKELNSLTDLISSNPGYSATWENYNKGWFSTNATLTISFDTAYFDPESSQVIDIPLTFNAKHGLFLFSDTQTLGLFSYELGLREEQSSTLEGILDFDKNQAFYTSTGAMDLTGNLTLNDKISAFSVSEESNELSFSGYTGSGTYSSSQVLDYEAIIGQFSFSGKEDEIIKVSESSLKMSADYGQSIAKNLAPSTASFNTDEIVIETNDGNGKFNDLAVLAELVIADDKKSFDMDFDISLANGVTGEESFEDLKFVFGYDNITTAFYEAYLGALENVDSFEDPAQLFTPEVLDEALSKGMGISADQLSVTLPKGKMSSSFNFSIPPQSNLTGETVLQNPLLLTQAVLVNVNISMDQPLAAQIARSQMEQTINQQLELQRAAGQEVTLTDAELDQLIDQSVDTTLATLIQQGFLIENNNLYESVMSFQNGQATINGVEIPLEALLQGAL